MLDTLAPWPAATTQSWFSDCASCVCHRQLLDNGVHAQGLISRLRDSINQYRNDANYFRNLHDRLQNHLNNVETNLNNRYNDAQNRWQSVQNSLTAIQTGIHDIGGCLATLPGSQPPMQALQHIAQEYQSGGASAVRSHVMTSTISPLLDKAVASVDNVVDGMTDIGDSLQNMYQDGQINQAVVNQLPHQVINLIVAQRANFPVLDCLMGNHGFMSDLNDVISAIGPFVISLAERTRTMLQALMARLVGPDSPFGRMITRIVNSLQTRLLPGMAVIDERIGQAISMTCQTRSRQLLAIAEGRSDSTVLCAATTNTLGDVDWHTMMVAAFTTVLTTAGDYVINALNEHVWQPLLQKLTAIAISSQDFILQVVDGVAGLIPEIGGIIATTLTTTISQVGTKISEVLASEEVMGITASITEALHTEAPVWADTIATSITSQVSSANAATQTAVAPALEFGRSTAPLAMPIMAVLVPLMSTLANSALPTIFSASQTCAADTQSLITLVRASSCAA